MYTYGLVPYSGNSNNEVVELVKQGKRLDQPETCPGEQSSVGKIIDCFLDDVYQLWTRCWSMEPKDRPTFTEILEFLNALQGEHSNAAVPFAPEEFDHAYQLATTNQENYQA